MTHKFPIKIEKDSYKFPIYMYSENIDKNDSEQLAGLTKLPYLIPPIVLLPDTHQKRLLETPSSSVILTQDKFSLSLTSPSQNCGMSLIQTPMVVQDISAELLEKIILKIKSVIPLANQNPVISREDVLEALEKGAKWAVKKYNLSQETCMHIECKGNLHTQCEALSCDIQKAIPEDIIDISRQYFNIIGGGNHFLEIQAVDEIMDERISRIWGVKHGQVVIMLHTGSELLGAAVGRLFAHRRKTSIKQHYYFYKSKIKHHLMQGPFLSLPQRLSYYFFPIPYRFIDPNRQEGKRVLTAINSSANFGFANRLSIINSIQNAFIQELKEESFKLNLLYDCSHNSIYPEQINGQTLWAHRHNACRVYPPSLLKDHPIFSKTGQPVILPGTNRTSSFLCVGREGVVATHYTVDHGLGNIQKQHEASGSTKETGEHSLFFSYERPGSVKTTLMDDAAITNAIENLTEADIINPVARLKPIATLKGPKPKII